MAKGRGLVDPLIEYGSAPEPKDRSSAAVVFSIFVAPWLCGIMLISMLISPLLERDLAFLRTYFPFACDFTGILVALCATIISGMLVWNGAREYLWNCVLNGIFTVGFLFPWLWIWMQT
jgi:hypothetical protein